MQGDARQSNEADVARCLLDSSKIADRVPPPPSDWDDLWLLALERMKVELALA